MTDEKSFPFFSQTDTVFKDADMLSPMWLPSAFLYRDKEYQDVGWMLRGHCDHVESNGFLVGPPGTGKTHIIKKLINEFSEHAEKNEMDYQWVYITCRHKFLLTALADMLVELGGRGIKKGNLNDYLSAIKMFAERKNVCFIFDEVDKMVPTPAHLKPVESLISIFSRFGEMYNIKGKIVSLVMIANNEKILDGVEKSAMSTFTPRRIRFKEYSTEEIATILKDRCDGGFQPNVLHIADIKWLAKQIEENNHDLRHALKTLKYAGEETRNQRGIVISRQCLTDSLIAIERQEVIDLIKERPPLMQILLFVIVRKEVEVSDGFVDNDMAYDGYVHFTTKLPKAKSLGGHTKSYVTKKVLPKMVEMGLIEGKIRGRGRGVGGRQKIYKPLVPGKDCEGEPVFKVNDSDILAYYDVLSEVMAEQFDINFETHRDEIVRFNHNKCMKNNKLF